MFYFSFSSNYYFTSILIFLLQEPPKTVLIKNGFENGEYLSELKKSYANGSDVGYYECLNEKNQSVSVYVFVNGEYAEYSFNNHSKCAFFKISFIVVLLHIYSYKFA